MSSVAARVDSDEQLARLLQIGVVLEEVVEARAHRHYQSLPEDERDDDIEALLSDASDESAEHRRRLESLIDELDAESVAFEEVKGLVEQSYGATGPEDFDGVLYDQLHGEETAYKFYADLIEAVEASEASFGVDRDAVLETLREIREAEAGGVEAVAKLMEDRA
ncbi:ferritin-like domain-containing protein [Halobacterium litoreum]|uniref:Ferritin-like domain-containing protein n=1 Tax=Halobacterium litoreum TaxID=2039234 RepID=A0ABD5NIE0_9EURY|nr:ferritin-like domain-containing protein [Halobacterium litoreum]UHH12516.1 ferritin-like domain-containing protein [Halobacterium litoreum]